MNGQQRNLRLLTEAVVVVASVLLAFGIEAWWGGLAERGEEADYLGSLESEIAVALRETRGDLEARMELLGALERFAATAPLPPDSLRPLLRRASRVVVVTPPTSTLEALISSGQLNLLRERELRMALVSFRTVLEKFDQLDQAHHRFVNERFVPYLSTEIPLAGILTNEPDAAALHTASNRQLDLLQQGEQFQNVMLERQLLLRRNLGLLGNAVRQLERINQLLDAEVGQGSA